MDIISQIEDGSFGKDVDFIKYALYIRDKKYQDSLNNNISKDLSNSEFAETASKTYGKMPLVRMLYSLNDSLALSQAFGNPVAVDEMHSPLLRTITEHNIGRDFVTLERLSQIKVVPDFSTMDLDSLLRLRKDKAIESFRELISRISSKLQSDNETEIDEQYVEELMKEIRELAPSKKELILDVSLGAVSTIPIPIVGIGTTLAGVGKELKEIRDFSKNWLSFILRMKKLT